MEEETDEYNPFIEESINDEPINNVSVCVYYDSSRIFLSCKIIRWWR